MSENSKKLRAGCIAVICISMTAGFISGMLSGFLYIQENRYFFHTMYASIVEACLSRSNKFIVLFIVSGCMMMLVAKITGIIRCSLENKQNDTHAQSVSNHLWDIFFSVMIICLGMAVFMRTGAYKKMAHLIGNGIGVFFASHLYFCFLLFAGILVFCMMLLLVHSVFKLVSSKQISSVTVFLNRFFRWCALGVSVLLITAHFAVAVNRLIHKLNKPNVILISIETLRADHLSCYGYNRLTSPHIDAFAQDSALFENALVPRGITNPSVTSFLTGYYPRTHGVRTLRQRMEPKWNTIAEFYRDNAYATAAFICNSVLIDYFSGLANGFDLYEQTMNERESQFKPQRIAQKANEAVYPWLSRHEAQPFFLWMHYMDPHGPYTAPEIYEDFAYTPQWRNINDIFIKNYMRKPLLWNDKNQVDVNHYISEYDKEIRYVDHYIGQLMNKLKELDLYDSSCIIITADHGEMLTEHDKFFRHEEYVYDATVRVPLLIKLPKDKYPWFKPGTRYTGQVCLIDLLPTVLDVSDIPYPHQFDGKSLLPILRGEKTDSHEYVYLEENVKSVGARTNQWKYVEYSFEHQSRKGASEFFNLSNDPDEQNSLSFAQLPDEAKEVYRLLHRRLNTWKKQDAGIDPQLLLDSTLDARTREMLKSLGYVN